MTATKQNYSDIIVHLKAAKHELEEAGDIADNIHSNSFRSGMITACSELVENVLERVEVTARREIAE